MKYFLVVMLLVSLYVACSDDDSSPQAKQPVVYCAGEIVIGTKSAAAWWKDGVLQQSLTDGTNQACANAIAVSGPDVFVAGYENSSGVPVAKYWKNKTGIALTDGTQNAYAKAMVLVP